MKEKIDTVFTTLDEKPLLYVESGSRLWGIASPDSDYDVRGVHLQSKRQYFDFRKHRDIIEVMDGAFDFVSYDLDKMFGLLAKSNPTVFEWIRSGIVYFNAFPGWPAFQQAVIANIEFKALFHHYLSLAKGGTNLMETGKKFTYKTLFYCIRGLLSADLAARHLIPELTIDALFKQFDTDNDVLNIAKESLEKKKQQNEKAGVNEHDKPKILTAVKELTRQLENHPPADNDKTFALNDLLTEYCYHIKTVFYRQ